MSQYAASLVYFYDDHKRSTAYSTFIGVFSSEVEAYQQALKMEILSNTSDEVREFGVGSDCPYAMRYLTLDIVTLQDKDTIEDEREEFLGKPDFGSMESTGHRLKIDEVRPVKMDEYDQKLEKRLLDLLTKTIEQNDKPEQNEGNKRPKREIIEGGPGTYPDSD